ncbi:hypothetical protein FRC00_001252 [Tulasnella sp. 408]|nr:hypothetical protein FRC00_001252 [Tulasnella sp. 408]
MPPRAEFRCDHNGVSKTVRLDYHIRWEEARVRFLDAMNVAPFERATVRIGCQNSDSRVTESPLAIDEALEWDDIMKTLRMHRNVCAQNSKLRPKEPVTILDITAPVADRTAPAKAGGVGKAKGKGHATSSIPEHSTAEVAAAQKKMRLEDAATTLRIHLKVIPPRRPGEKAKHVPWTLSDLITWAKYMVAGLADAKTPPPEVLQRTQQEDALAESIRKPSGSQRRRYQKHSELSDPLSGSDEGSEADDQPKRKAPRLGLDSKPWSANSHSKSSANPGPASYQPTVLTNPQDYPLTASFLSDLENHYAGDFEFKKFAHAIGRVHGLVRINHLVAAGGDNVSAHWLSELVDGLDLGTAQILWDEARTRVQIIEANRSS